MRTNHINLNLLPLEIISVNTIKDENYINDLEGYGWGLGFRVLMNRTKKIPMGILVNLDGPDMLQLTLWLIQLINYQQF